MVKEQIKILVVGDLMLDKYIWGSANRLSPEAPVPIVKIEEENFSLGGACNVANNLIAMEAFVSIYGVVGNDIEGDLLRDFLVNKGIDSNCYKSNRPTTTKMRIMASKHQMLRLDKENNNPLESKIYEAMFEDIQKNIAKYHCMILSDYLKGVLSADFTQKLIKLANSFDIPVLCDPKGSDYAKYKHATLLTPNKKEAIEATHVDISNDNTLLEALQKMSKICSVTYPLITLSEDGIAYLGNDGNLHKKPTIAKEVYDVSGAGDTVIAALALQFAKGKSIQEATIFANAAAAVVIGKIGSATATLKEIQDYLAPKRILRDAKSKIIVDFLEIKEHISGKKIVFTNGCFDILHYGHVSYLEKARKLGEVLIVGLNSDDSIKRLKGKDRPINTQVDRAFILASLACVSYVIIFNEDTPENLISKIKPNVLVKGADYKDKVVVGSKYADSVEFIEFINNKSTTNIINKIQNQAQC